MKKFFAFMAKVVAKFHMPFNHKKMTELDCLKVINLMQDGDILLSKTNGELSNVFLEEYSHAGIVNKSMIFEAVTGGTKVTDPMFFLSRKDGVILLRPRFKVEINDLNYFLHENLNKAYDFEFEDRDGQFYCYEYVASAINESSFVKIEKVRTPLGLKFMAKSFLVSDSETIWEKA